jgi:Na+/proline symporter
MTGTNKRNAKIEYFQGMNIWIPVLTAALYFAGLLLIARLTSKKGGNSMQDFYLAGKQVPWYLVAWGMLGNSLSGVTFISVPGTVGNSGMEYFQVVLGYIAGYTVIAFVLLPLYYRLNLTTIYGYLEQRIGPKAYKTGAWFFLISRLLGTSARLLLVAGVLQYFLFDRYHIPFAVTVAGTLSLIMLYTVNGGMKTLVWTDVLQSTCLVGAVLVTLYLMPFTVADEAYTRIINWDVNHSRYFWKQFIGGAFIAIVMTGLDQDQMQKNLICKNLKDAKTNMLSFSLAMAIVNLGFLFLGVMLYSYCDLNGLTLPARTDHVYPWIALEVLGGEIPLLAILFMLGLTASAYSSADGALTALTTSFCVDILGLKEDMPQAIRTRRRVHIGMAVSVFLCILALQYISEHQTQDTDNSIITMVLRLAGFSYGPLLGMFAFGLLTRRKTVDAFVPVISVLIPVLMIFLYFLQEYIWLDYRLGNELLLLNGTLVFLTLLLFSKEESNQIQTHK